MWMKPSFTPPKPTCRFRKTALLLLFSTWWIPSATVQNHLRCDNLDILFIFTITSMRVHGEPNGNQMRIEEKIPRSFYCACSGNRDVHTLFNTNPCHFFFHVLFPNSRCKKNGRIWTPRRPAWSAVPYNGTTASFMDRVC